MRYLTLGLWAFLMGANLRAQVSHAVLAVDGSANPVNGNEPSISIDRARPMRTLIGVNTNNVLFTEDVGLQRWQPIMVNPPQGFYGDPVMKSGKNGLIYLAHLAKNKQGVWPQFFDRIVFERSADGGQTFSAVDVGFHEGKMQDKPWFTLDEWDGSPGKGNVYLTWTEFDKYGSGSPQDSSRIWFARAKMGLGEPFETPVVISDRGGDAMDDDGTAEGANIAVTPDGVLHAVWSRSDTLWYDCSRDQGKTWGKDRFLAVQPGGWNHENVRGTMRVNGMPFAVSDARGNVVVVYSRLTCNKTAYAACNTRDVWAVVKWAGGEVFSQPVPLNMPQKGAVDAAHRMDPQTPDFGNTEQYSPMVVTSPNHKRIFVAWQDRRRSATGAFFDVYGAEIRVANRWGVGERFLHVGGNVRLSKTASMAPGNAVFMGDYIGLDWEKDIVLAYTGFDVSRSHPVVHLSRLTVKPRWFGINKLKGVEGISEPGLSFWVMNDIQEKSSTQAAVVDNRKDKKIFIWAEWPGVTNFTVELKMGSQVVMSHVFENVLDGKVDFELPLSRFVPGSYEIVLRKKSRSVSLPVYLK